MSDSTASSSVASSPASSAVLGPSSASTTSIASAPSSPKGSFLTNDATVTAALKTQPGTMGNCLSSIRGYAQSAVAVQEARDIDFEPKLETIQPLTNSGNKGTSFAANESSSITDKHTTTVTTTSDAEMSLSSQRALRVLSQRPTPIDKYLYLSSLKATNPSLFFRLLIDNFEQLMPLVYTPTIGDVCLQYSTLFTRPEALYIPITQRNSIKEILRSWTGNPSICVVTDGSRILGLGDLGVNGVGISIGKLALYTAAAGIPPDQTLPIVLDYGTENADNLADPLYLGLRQHRVPKEDAQLFMDQFMDAVREVYPSMLVQFEDFETEKAFGYLERYKDRRCFNDDIQGTGAVVLAGYMAGVKLSGVPVDEQRIVFMGAGSAGVGVAKQVLEYYTREPHNLSEEEAKKKFFLVDTKGLVTADRGDRLAEHKKYFARSDLGGRQCRTLEEVIEFVKPSALIGLAATGGIFTEEIVRSLTSNVTAGAGGATRRPILFPLSNPTTKAECTFAQAIEWTDGKAIFASGSPFPAYTPSTPVGDHKTYYPNQGNNVYVFPGLGMGAILAKADKVTDDMVYASAAALCDSLTQEEVDVGLIYPRIERVRQASVEVAREVMKMARRDGVDGKGVWREEWKDDNKLEEWIRAQVYDPLVGEVKL